MLNAIWPLFNLEVRTPKLTLRYVDEALGAELAHLAAHGVHDPSFMPFAFPWTDAVSPQLERNTMQHYWQSRAEHKPESWRIALAVVVDGTVVGASGLTAQNFSTLRQFETGSWLGLEYHGKGYGKELREASLHLGFAGLEALRATTCAYHDNEPSLGVTRGLGYQPNGNAFRKRRDLPTELQLFVMDHDYWAMHRRRDDIEIYGLDACRDLLIEA